MSQKKIRFRNKYHQAFSAGVPVDKLIPRGAHGDGTYLSQLQQGRNGRLLGFGAVCTRPAGPDTEARMRRWAGGK